MHTWAIIQFMAKEPNRERTVTSKMVLGKMDRHTQKHETELPYYIIHTKKKNTK